MQNNRFVLKIGGESGQGINSVGEILSKVIKNSGYKIFSYREYPSLIKGGYASFQIDISDQNINSSSKYCNLLICMSRLSIHKYLESLESNGVLIHILPKFEWTAEEEKFIKKNKIQIIYLDLKTLITDETLILSPVLGNALLLGVACKVLGLDIKFLQHILSLHFKDKPEALNRNNDLAILGYSQNLETTIALNFEKDKDWYNSIFITGNDALAIGAISSGVKAYYAYPMTPATSILSFLAELSAQTGMVVKQVEDEITAAQMAIGSMFMGARALTATSGGGFDLMTESISLVGMTETPFVCILGQRPGPATGLPTWTSAADLNLAIYSGHGEYPKCVIAVSDIGSCFELIQNAFNIAEKFQIPVILLTEKQIAESFFNLKNNFEYKNIERYLESGPVESTDRYKLTENGISPRWLPGQNNATFTANSDEHLSDGSLTEEAIPSEQMYAKRLRKLVTLKTELPEPTVYGNKKAELSFIGWGSTKNVMSDVINLAKYKINYLHFDYIYPLKTDGLNKFLKNSKKIVLIENNYSGQLGELITKETGYQFENKFLKYNGRPFFIEDICEFIENNL